VAVLVELTSTVVAGQLDKWIYVPLQQSIVESIDVLEVLLSITLCVFPIDSHIVVQNAVHANVHKPNLSLQHRKLLLPIGTQPFIRTARTNDTQRNLRMRADSLSQVSANRT
jgi:hypothetical protein